MSPLTASPGGRARRTSWRRRRSSSRRAWPQTGMPKRGRDLRRRLRWLLMLIIWATSFGCLGRRGCQARGARSCWDEQSTAPPRVRGKRFYGYFSRFLPSWPGWRQPTSSSSSSPYFCELLRADAADPQQRSREDCGRRLGDLLERGVAEDHERRHLLLAGPLVAPLAQPLEQLLVVGRRAVGAAAAGLLGRGLAAACRTRRHIRAPLRLRRLAAPASASCGQQRVEEPRRLAASRGRRAGGPAPTRARGRCRARVMPT